MKFLPTDYDEAQHSNQPLTIKRKASKRRLVDSDEEEVAGDTADPRSEPPRVKRAKPVLAKGSKGKAGKDKDKEKEIMIKDERKLATPGSPLPSASQTQASDLFAEDESSVPPPSAVEPSAVADHSTLPPSEPAKKRKLPTIKKNKPAASGATSTPSQSTTAPSKPPLASDDMTKIVAPSNQQRKPAALMGATDFDLRDKSVYAELFKGVRRLDIFAFIHTYHFPGWRQYSPVWSQQERKGRRTPERAK